MVSSNKLYSCCFIIPLLLHLDKIGAAILTSQGGFSASIRCWRRGPCITRTSRLFWRFDSSLVRLDCLNLCASIHQRFLTTFLPFAWTAILDASSPIWNSAWLMSASVVNSLSCRARCDRSHQRFLPENSSSAIFEGTNRKTGCWKKP